MNFYSGFSLRNEQYLFEGIVTLNKYTINGFSYGAISAIKETLLRLESKERVDRLQLLSPAFFQTKEKKFKRLQLMSYKKNKELYMKQFISSCFAPYNEKIVEHKETSVEELEELLEYKYSLEDLKLIEESGVVIEVYLGGRDSIIDVNAAREFFLQVATVTYIKDANHFLQIQ